jgi:Flp pilus assembly protein TadD
MAFPPLPAPLSRGLGLLLLIAAGFSIYGPTLNGGWVWDDTYLVEFNHQLRSLPGLADIWLAPPASFYWPLTWTFLWIQWHLWGAATLGYHLVNLLLHLASALLIWRVLERLGLRWGWLAALIFIVHPLAVESVAWISEVKNTLSLPLYLLAFDAWLSADEAKPHAYLRCVLLYLAAMLAKTTTIVLPLVLLLYCWWKRGRVTRVEFLRILPFLAIAAILGLVTIHAQGAMAARRPFHESLTTRLLDAGACVVFYLHKFLLPLHLDPLYPQRGHGPAVILAALTGALLIVLLAVLARSRIPWGRHVVFALGFFLLNLLPVCGLIPVGGASWVADHHAYLPMIGLIALAVLALQSLHDRFPRARLPEFALIALLAAGLALASHAYSAVFASNQALWAYVTTQNPRSALAQNNLGYELLLQGQFTPARQLFLTAIRLDPTFAYAYNNLGDVLLRRHDLAGSMAQYQKGAAVDPRDPGARDGMGNVLLQSGQFAAAAEQFRQALALDPNNVAALKGLGLALNSAGQFQDALAPLQQAVALDPNDTDVHYNLGIAYAHTSHLPQAMEQYRQALALDPTNANVYNNVGNLFFAAHQWPQACDAFALAVKLKPDFAEAYNNLGSALAMSGRFPDAAQQFQLALKYRPDYPEARANLTKVQALEKTPPAP